jgi:hypothetical protein
LFVEDPQAQFLAIGTGGRLHNSIKNRFFSLRNNADFSKNEVFEILSYAFGLNRTVDHFFDKDFKIDNIKKKYIIDRT